MGGRSLEILQRLCRGRSRDSQIKKLVVLLYDGRDLSRERSEHAVPIPDLRDRLIQQPIAQVWQWRVKDLEFRQRPPRNPLPFRLL
jgi:hypothetical protein